MRLSLLISIFAAASVLAFEAWRSSSTATADNTQPSMQSSAAVPLEPAEEPMSGAASNPMGKVCADGTTVPDTSPCPEELTTTPQEPEDPAPEDPAPEETLEAEGASDT